ncbi:MAG: energy-dependent translational throttle protein EttA, partial [Candidatus Nucleicultricaceae bacterium]
MASYQYIYVMKDLSKTFPGGRQVLKNIYLSFFPGAKIGVIGVNGSGKSTLLKIMAGLDPDFTGEAWPAEGVSVGYLAQEPELDDTKTVQENIMGGLKHIQDLLTEFDAVSAKFAEEMTDEEMTALIDKQAELQEKIDAVDGWNLNRTIDIAMDALRCPSGDAMVKTLSGGERRRVALCRLLLQKPDMLLLDEPTNHLDAESVAWLENYLKEYKGTVVLITHDRYFLDNVVGWILELDRGEGIPFEGNYSSWLEQKRKRLEVEEKQESDRQKTLLRELEWIQQSPKARQAKSKARIQAYQTLLTEESEKRSSPAQIYIPAGPRLGDVVVELESVRKAFGDRLLIDDLSFKIPPGSILGIIGPNGAGKTTLCRMITTSEVADSGTVRIGDTVKLGYIDQSRDALKADNTVWEEISEGQDEIELGKRKVQSRAYCSFFNFKGVDQQKKVGQLSGG